MSTTPEKHETHIEYPPDSQLVWSEEKEVEAGNREQVHNGYMRLVMPEFWDHMDSGQIARYVMHKAVDRKNKGEETWYYMPDWWVVVHSPVGYSRIYKPIVPHMTLCHDNYYVTGVTNTIRVKGNSAVGGEDKLIRIIPLHIVYNGAWSLCFVYQDEGNAVCTISLELIEPR